MVFLRLILDRREGHPHYLCSSMRGHPILPGSTATTGLLANIACSASMGLTRNLRWVSLVYSIVLPPSGRVALKHRKAIIRTLAILSTRPKGLLFLSKECRHPESRRPRTPNSHSNSCVKTYGASVTVTCTNLVPPFPCTVVDVVSMWFRERCRVCLVCFACVHGVYMLRECRVVCSGTAFQWNATFGQDPFFPSCAPPGRVMHVLNEWQ